ncbi:hypothetical protein QFC22_000838 [Naganishia vaughanmartiniae]|uniref:Uncharacterized protein n=1 Tax=Naganishia vaughanmartiniae TaxID=1424756 RepID=A0ACC2XJ51_9TREE|nr:hypothetical protein QFC22_000838 [Naganishia vaughanmartiniae]
MDSVRVLQVPEEERFAAAPAFYRAVWGSRNDDVLLMNATRVWFLDLEQGPELIVNTIDTSHTTTLFTSIDPSGAERDSEYLCLCTTDAVMWLDARDGQLVLSWEHMRHGETLEVRAMAGKVDTSEETVFLVRSLENRKATLLHVRESIEGIQSRRDPYDVLLLGQDTSLEPFTSTARRMIGLSSMFIEDSPTPLSLLLFLEDNGQLSCGLQQPTNSPHVAAETLGTNVKGRPKSTGPVTPDQLILRRHLLECDSQSDEDMVDGDILRDMFPPEEKTGDEQDIEDTSNKSYKRIKTGALWQNFCDAKNSAEAVFSLASLRSFLNDHEELPDTGIFTLHEFLAMACESADSDDRCVRSDSLKSYALGLSHDRVEKLQQFQDLLERLNAVLNRSDFGISQLRDTIFRITGEISLASAPSTALESLEEGYLGGIEVYSPDEPLAEVHQRQQDATFRLLCDLHISATTLVSPTDDSAQHNYKDINISETLSRLSFSRPSKGTAPRTAFLKAMASAECSETTSITLQTLSSQWEIGSDPGQYAWPGKSNHRALDPGEDLPASLPPPPVRNPTSDVRTFRLPRQSALFNSSPALHPLSTPNFGTGESLPISNTPSQVHFEGDSQRQSQDFASSQVLQGPFGGRNGTSFRKSLGKKRTIGF